MEIVDRSIILSFDELRILLFSQGYRHCDGVYMPEKEFSTEDILLALQKLVRDGLLTVELDMQVQEELPLVFEEEILSDEIEERFFIRKDLLIMLKIIGEPDSTEILDIGNGRRVFCYYSEQGIVTSEKYPNRRNALRLGHHTPDSFRAWKSESEVEVQ